MAFSDKFKELRKMNNLSQAQVAYKLGNIERSNISHWESGRSTPDYETINMISEMFGVTVDYLIGKTNAPLGEVNTKLTIMNNVIPVYGRLPAGTPIEAIEDIDGNIEIPSWLAKKKNLIGLKIVGDSMNKIIPNGAVAVLQKTSHLENGEVGAIMVNGYDATLKKFYKLTDSIVLEPLSYDESFKPTVIKDGEEPVEVVGKLLWFSSQEGCKF